MCESSSIPDISFAWERHVHDQLHAAVIQNLKTSLLTCQPEIADKSKTEMNPYYP